MQTAKSPQGRRMMTVAIGISLVLLVITSMAIYRRFFALPKMVQPLRSRGQWSSFGGTWSFTDSGIENASDERGAKLVFGSPYWKDYNLSADVQLEGDDGDAGLIARVQEPDEGVDAFRGIYVGLRLQDNSLIAGQADYGWTESAPERSSTRLQPFTWYHLSVAVEDCHLSVTASLPGGAPIARIDAMLDQCSRRGQIGLRSYRSGGAWRSIRVDPVNSPERVRR